MKRAYRKSRRYQLDEKLNPFRKLRTEAVVEPGWVRTIRDALGMTTTQLAKRVGTNQSNIVRIERREQEGTISINILKKVAAALQCDLICVLVPRMPLDQIVQNQATKVAHQEVTRISHTMSLEDQSTAARSQAQLIEDVAAEFVRNTPSKLWNENE